MNPPMSQPRGRFLDHDALACAIGQPAAPVLISMSLTWINAHVNGTKLPMRSTRDVSRSSLAGRLRRNDRLSLRVDRCPGSSRTTERANGIALASPASTTPRILALVD